MSPSIIKIIKSDYTALILLIVPLVAWGLYVGTSTGVVGAELGPTAVPFFFGTAIIGSVLCIPALVWRINAMLAMFRSGKPAKGTITSVWFFKDRGRVEYTYTFEGREYHSGNALHKTAAAKSLKEGDEIDILVDPSKPSRAIIPELYT